MLLIEWILQSLLCFLSNSLFHSSHHRTSLGLRSKFLNLAKSRTVVGSISMSTSPTFTSSSSVLSTMSTVELVESQVKSAVFSSFGLKNFPAMVFTGKPEFGDYQCNVAMPLSKELKLKPKDVAEKIKEALHVLNTPLGSASTTSSAAVTTSTPSSTEVIGSMDISGPGFINIHLSSQYLKNKLFMMQGNASNRSTTSKSNSTNTTNTTTNRVGIAKTTNPERIIVDFSSPNIAKEMHVVSLVKDGSTHKIEH